MFVALDSNGQKIGINAASREKHYFCPLCKKELIVRKGSVRCHHFAHKSDSDCLLSRLNDLSIWHLNWQNRFPIETQEIVLIDGDKTHRADILIKDSRLVLEFQHSPITSAEFNERNSFYNSLGYKVIWLFDVEKSFSVGNLTQNIDHLRTWFWKRHYSTFDSFSFNSVDVDLYFQFVNVPADSVLSDEKKFSLSLRATVEEIEHGAIYKLEHTNEINFRSIKFSSKLTNDEFVNTTLNAKNSNGDFLFELLSDQLEESTTINGSVVLIGCPISQDGKCVSSYDGLNNTQKLYYKSCDECCHSGIVNNRHVCYKRFKDAKVPSEGKITKVNRSANGKLLELFYTLNGENKKYVFPSSMAKHKIKRCGNIVELWNLYNPKQATFKNLSKGYYVRIVSNPINQLKTQNYIKGKKSSNKYHFDGPDLVINDYATSNWCIIWRYK